MRKKIAILMIIGLVSFEIKAQVNFIWAESIAGSSTLCAGASIGVDGTGNVYTSGYFDGTADFDPGIGLYNLNSLGAKDIFVSKLDASGIFVWAKRIGGAGADVGQSIAVNTAGDVFVTGYFNGTVDFDPGPGTFTIVSAGLQDMFILKLDASGNFVWAKSMGGANDEFGYSITIDALSNVYTTGYYNGTVDFDPGPVVFNLIGGFFDIFVSKLDASGNFVWAKTIGGSNGDAGYSIAVDAVGNVYTTGYFQGTADFDPGIGIYNLTSFGGPPDVYINKLDPSGSFVWAKSIETFGVDRGTSIAVDATGNVYTTGMFIGGLNDFDPGPSTYTLPTSGGITFFINKLDPLGNFVWAKSIDGSQSEGLSIKVDAINNVYTTGYYYGTTDFDPGIGVCTITSIGNSDIFVNMFDASGNYVWTKSMGGIDYDFGYSLLVDLAGNIYTAGFYNGIADFDPGAGIYNLTSVVGQEVFIQKMHQVSTSIKENFTSLTTCIYPNPNSGSFKIQMDNEIKNGEIILINSLGQKVFEQKVMHGANQINTSGFSAGLYNCILLQDKQQVGCSKLVVE